MEANAICGLWALFSRFLVVVVVGLFVVTVSVAAHGSVFILVTLIGSCDVKPLGFFKQKNEFFNWVGRFLVSLN